MTEHVFMQTLGEIEQKLKEAKGIASLAALLFEAGKWETAYEEALQLANRLEVATLYARELPACTGNRFAREDIERVMEESVPVEIGFTEQGWFCLRMPALLPKKRIGSGDYVRQFLYPAMQRFIGDKDIEKYDKAVLVFRHVYPTDHPERLMRDHDNFEVNVVSDVVALYMLRDDAPKYCNHYYCSAKGGNHSRTEVYVVPQTDFKSWQEYEETIPDEGVKLYEPIIERSET